MCGSVCPRTDPNDDGVSVRSSSGLGWVGLGRRALSACSEVLINGLNTGMILAMVVGAGTPRWSERPAWGGRVLGRNIGTAGPVLVPLDLPLVTSGTACTGSCSWVRVAPAHTPDTQPLPVENEWLLLQLLADTAETAAAHPIIEGAVKPRGAGLGILEGLADATGRTLG